MKKKIYFLLIVAAMSACNNNNDKEAANKDSVSTTIITDTARNIISIPGKLCFQRVLQRDTISIELFIKDSVVSGNLIYNFYEKDRNKGTFNGSIHGGIIKADYTYASEGKTSIREVMFQLKDSVLTEGFGVTLMQDNKSIFKDTSKIQYTQVFKRVNCK
ncbi:hypothetical protein FRZ67_06260 [Panacibacter ginsenosidivorans]|uniref:Uncharacterized protein n=1 Tax=Panacibacter ginsenosidivorans TaxID=1813871 RepID=A0A5B8V989_9BACT|nr:hypothetical protein [Panacibacter ginsenosidivorans]QEC66918.1 hypothetical protein FRZ67_06260 [Panacibacter ginsenosidivorans]